MKNFGVDTGDKLICLYTSDLARAKQLVAESIKPDSDVYEIPNEDMQYYCFDARVTDNEAYEAERVA